MVADLRGDDWLPFSGGRFWFSFWSFGNALQDAARLGLHIDEAPFFPSRSALVKSSIDGFFDARMNIHDDYPIKLGSIDVTAGEVVVGDCNYPPPGLRIRPVPSGRAVVRCAREVMDGDSVITKMAVVFRHADDVQLSPGDRFSIDGVLLMVADSAYGHDFSGLQRKELRRRMEGEVAILLGRGDSKPSAVGLITESNAPWAVVFKPGFEGDGIYDVELWRDAARICAVTSEFVDSLEDE